MEDSAVRVLSLAILSALLLSASVSDLRARRIPNAIVVVTLVVGALEALGGVSLAGGLGPAGEGLLLAGAIWIPFHLLGMVGAGDVKLAAAAGVWLGPRATLEAMLAAAILGGVLALLAVVWRRSAKATAANLGVVLAGLSRGQVVQAPDLALAAGTIPYGIAISAGVLLVAWRVL